MSSFKAIRDECAKWLGRNDNDPRIEWRYEQRAGEPGIEIQIEGENP